MKLPKPNTPNKPKRGNRYLDDSGFSEESPKDKAIYNRSKKINPTSGQRNRRYEAMPDELMFRRSRRAAMRDRSDT